MPGLHEYEEQLVDWLPRLGVEVALMKKILQMESFRRNGQLMDELAEIPDNLNEIYLMYHTSVKLAWTAIVAVHEIKRQVNYLNVLMGVFIIFVPVFLAIFPKMI